MNNYTRCDLIIHAALVSSRAFIIPSHNKKHIRLLSLFLVIFLPQCVSQYLKNNGKESPGRSSEDKIFFYYYEKNL